MNQLEKSFGTLLSEVSAFCKVKAMYNIVDNIIAGNTL
tara:strand:- start:2 stop:115 length:114 start_codon:yes stop_codon:yes gene_type:complete